MKLLRVIVLVFVSLALPAYGYAGLRLAHRLCSMHTMGMVHASGDNAGAVSADVNGRLGDAAVAPGAATTDDCCADAETFAKSGKPCKSGQECQAVHLLGTAADGSSLAAATASSVTSLADDSPRGNCPQAVWRPPRFL